MIVLVVYVARNCLEHIQSQWEKSVQFPANYQQQQNISDISAEDTSNKFKKWNIKYNKDRKWIKGKWSSNIFSKMTNDVK